VAVALEQVNHRTELRVAERAREVRTVLRGLLAAVLGVGGDDDGQHARHDLVESGAALGHFQSSWLFLSFF